MTRQYSHQARSALAQAAERQLTITYLPSSALQLDPTNARKHSARQLAALGRSIAAFGFVAPILVDRDRRIVAGHARFEAATKRGMRELPVVQLDHLSPDQVRALAIADNRLAELATWDDRALGAIFEDLSALELDFDLEATGFTLAEIDLQIEGLHQHYNGQLSPADDAVLPICRGQPAKTKAGDIWQLGRHRLLCGDARASASYCQLLGQTTSAAVFTDPPYNVPIHGHVSGKGRLRHREFAMASGEMSDAEFEQFLATVMQALVRHTRAGSLHYLCMDWRHGLALMRAGEQAYSELKNICVWAKDKPGLGSLYRSQHELVFVYKAGRAPHRNNVQLGRFGRNRSNVWSFPGTGGIGRATDEGDLRAIHPTIKPVALIAEAILDCTARGDLVLDPFLGSGSTLIAAERTGRLCRGIELDPLYVDAAVRRWQTHTGDHAVHAESGAAFDDAASGARRRKANA